MQLSIYWSQYYYYALDIMLHILKYNILDHLRSYCPVIVPPRPASVETSASEQRNSPASYRTYKSHNNYNRTTQTLYYVLIEHADFMQE